MTGYTDEWSANNIYDFAGNVWEWTAEKFNNNIISRSGSCIANDASNGRAAYRQNNTNADSTYGSLGFRIVLYIL